VTLLGQLGHDRFAVLTLSADHGAFVVEDEWAGHDPDAAPQAMAVIWFDGPLAEPVLDAARYGGEHRLTPAIQATPGHRARLRAVGPRPARELPHRQPAA
jgi:hypothetical protein